METEEQQTDSIESFRKRSNNNKNVRLPPVVRDSAYYHDAFENCFLKTFNLKKQNEQKLKNIIMSHALNEISSVESRPRIDLLKLNGPDFPNETMSQDRMKRVSFFFISCCCYSSPNLNKYYIFHYQTDQLSLSSQSTKSGAHRANASRML